MFCFVIGFDICNWFCYILVGKTFSGWENTRISKSWKKCHISNWL